jgi:hypothetical protein
MSNKREALEAALSALESERIMAKDGQGNYTIEVTPKRIIDAIEKVKAALAEPEQEPIRWLVDEAVWERKPTTDDVQMWKDCGMKIMPTIRPLYTSPQPREWQELSEVEVKSCEWVLETEEDFEPYTGQSRWIVKGVKEYAKLISASLRAKNGG